MTATRRAYAPKRHSCPAHDLGSIRTFGRLAYEDAAARGRLASHSISKVIIMNSRKMLLRSILALGMGGVGLVHARSADAADARAADKLMFDQCHACVLGGCGGAYQFCSSNGCNTSMIGCGEFGSCTDPYGVVSCNDSSY